jgi:hypothetical protein
MVAQIIRTKFLMQDQICIPHESEQLPRRFTYFRIQGEKIGEEKLKDGA